MQTSCAMGDILQQRKSFTVQNNTERLGLASSRGFDVQHNKPMLQVVDLDQLPAYRKNSLEAGSDDIKMFKSKRHGYRHSIDTFYVQNMYADGQKAATGERYCSRDKKKFLLRNRSDSIQWASNAAIGKPGCD